MTWDEGKATVERLLGTGELQRVTADLEMATELLARARRHLTSAKTIRDTDAEGAYATLYDAARTACAALLQAQGLRATTRGGHIAIREAVVAQFASLTGGMPLRSFDRLRRRRHEVEYGPSAIVDQDEVDEALTRAEEIVSFAERLAEQLPVF